MNRCKYLFLLVISSWLWGQNPQQKQWVLGSDIVDFSSGTPVLSSSIGTSLSAATNSVTDPQGNLLFAVLDMKVVDMNGTVMGQLQNQLNHEVAIVPFPDDCDKYWLLYFGAIPSAEVAFYYSVVDMSLRGGLGMVTLSNVEIDKIAGTNLGALAVSQPTFSGSRWVYISWLNSLSRYLIDSSGLHFSGTVVDGSHSDFASRDFETIELDLSHDGRKLAWGRFDFSSGEYFVASLDSNGNYQSVRKIPVNGMAGGVEFSPNGNYLFFSGPDLNYQDLSTLAPPVAFVNATGYGQTQLELAYDGNIYAGSSTGLGAIASPDNPTPNNFTPAVLPGVLGGFVLLNYTLPDQIDGEIYDLNFGQCTTCIKPPPGMASWWSFDQFTTAGVDDLAGGHDGALQGIFNLVPGRVGIALQFNGSGYVEVPGAPDLALGKGDFSVDGWLRSSTQGLASILDKRTAINLGYHVAMSQGQLVMQLGDAGSAANFLSNSSVNDGQWHHFAISVDRDQSDGLKIYIDGNLDALHDPTGVSGDLSNSEDLWIGGHQQLFLANWQGDLDEIEIFTRALSQAEVTGLFQAQSGKCREAVHVPWDKGFCPIDTTTIVTLTVCNYDSVDHDYFYQMKGLPGEGPGEACNVDGPTPGDITFLDNNPFTVPAQSCGQVMIQIDRPVDLNVSNQVGCFQVVVQNQDTGAVFASAGSVQAIPYCAVPFEDTNGGFLALTPGFTTTVAIENDTDTFATFDYRFEVMPDGVAYSLNGLEPGAAATGTLDIPVGESRVLDLKVDIARDNPFEFQDLILTAEVDGDSFPLYSVGLRNPTLSERVKIIQHPRDRLACFGETFTLEVVASGEPSLTYQWRRNGVPLSGRTGPTLTFGFFRPSQSGRYDCVVTNRFGSRVTRTVMVKQD